MTIDFNEYIIALRLTFGLGNESYLSGSFRSHAENSHSLLQNGFTSLVFRSDAKHISKHSLANRWWAWSAAGGCRSARVGRASERSGCARSRGWPFETPPADTTV